MADELFYVECEVRYADPENGEMLKAFVNCYTYAVQRERAVGKVRSALREDGYDVLEVRDAYETCAVDFGETEDKEHGEPTQADLAAVRANEDVYFAYFHAYPEATDDGNGPGMAR
ncbi:MAG: hypothetical protein ACYTFI_18060 [Planctomycetota bacterium]|jgi:hypothetical protein